MTVTTGKRRPHTRELHELPRGGHPHTAAHPVTTGKENCCSRELGGSCGPEITVCTCSRYLPAASQALESSRSDQGWGITPTGHPDSDRWVGDSQSRDLKSFQDGFALRYLSFPLQPFTPR